jgi:hypothetical protein
MVMVGAIFYPLEDVKTLLPAWRAYMATAPDELSSLAICWSVPAAEPFPPELHGAPVFVVAGTYSGSLEDGEPVVQPLRELGEPLIDLSGPWPWLGLQSGFDALYPKGSRAGSTSFRRLRSTRSRTSRRAVRRPSRTS